MENKNYEPYSVLFSLGLVSALLGSFFWIGFQNHLINFYPRQAHGNLMFFAFLWAYVTGFLMTAVPKMTQTKAANWVEIFVALFFVVIQWVVNLRNQLEFSLYIYILQIIFLIFFLARRFLQKKQMPFEGFVFLPFAFLSVFMGIGYRLVDPNNNVALGYHFLGQGFILNLICGLGSRLIPVLTRVPNSLNPDIQGKNTKVAEYLLMALGLNLGLWLEALYDFKLGSILKLLVLGFIFVKNFKVFQTPSVRSFLGYGIRLSIAFMFIGYLLQAFFYEGSLAVQHLVYIGGFSLMTLMISTRVTLAHGSKDMAPELTSKSLGLIILLFATAAILRFITHQNISGLLFLTSALVFIAALGLWIYRFVKDLLKIS